jgi:hypothetical protein
MTFENTILVIDLIQPGDPDCEQARRVYNGMIDRRPRMIVRCANVADVIRSVNFTRDNNLLAAEVTTVLVLATPS